MECHCVTLFAHIETWCSIQTLYMPGVTQLRQINAHALMLYHYITYAQTHPPKFQMLHHKATSSAATQAEEEDSESGSNKDNEGSRDSSSEGDDVDVSP
jgi:hypothetical protein